MAGAIAELANRALATDFRTIDPRYARILLVEAAPRLLTPFDPPLSEAAERSLEQLGVEVRPGTAVTALDAQGVSIGTRADRGAHHHLGRRRHRLARGAMARRRDRPRRPRDVAARSLGARAIPTSSSSATPPRSTTRTASPLPGIAPVAKQQGQYVAALLVARAAGRDAARRSAIATSARSPPSAANAPSSHIGRFKLTGLSRGCCGASRTSTS